MLIKLREGESITVGMNFDKSKQPLSYTIMIIDGNLILRESGERSEGDLQLLK